MPELRTMLRAVAGERLRLFNTAGRDYRALKLAVRLPDLADNEALGLLAANGNLIKRPFLIGPGVALVGFDEPRWAAVWPP
jgi:arsenate reductase